MSDIRDMSVTSTTPDRSASGHDTRVRAHYEADDILDRIKAALAAVGANPSAPTSADLKAVDEFHTGGLPATDHLLDQLHIDAKTRVLDIGCGIGGTVRHVANRFSAQVTGVDLTPAYVRAATALSTLTKTDGQTRFLQGSALDLPFPASSFDLALMLHVGMNIPDKNRLFAESARVLGKGGVFALFDVMRTDEGTVGFPLPWAEDEGASFVGSPQAYRAAALQAGFTQETICDRSDFSRDVFANAHVAAKARGGPPPVGLHLLMRDTAGQKTRNYAEAIDSGRFAPIEMTFRKET